MESAGGLSRLVARATAAVERTSHELEPELLDGEAALGLFESLARLGKLVEACQTVVSRRIDGCGAHRKTHHLSTAHLLAATAGMSLASATDTIRTGRQLVDQPAVNEAFRSGHLSLRQASAISDAVAADPTSERRLLEAAPRETLRTLQERARAVCAAVGEDRLGRYRRQHANHSFRHRTGADGMVRGEFAFPPDVGAAVVNRIEAGADAEYRRAYADGRREPHHCYGADALERLVRGTATTKPRVGEFVIVVSRESLVRGSVEPGETCTVAGFGDMPVDVARELMADAFLKGVVVDGTRVELVRHFGRRASAAVRTALAVSAVLRDGSVVCAAPGCDRRAGIEWDHVEPHGTGGATEVANLQPLCRAHHREKTLRDDPRTRAATALELVPP